MIIIVACVRTEHTYQQGVERELSRLTKDDYFVPLYEGISEQPVYNREIFASAELQDMSGVNDETFGFEPYGESYRTKQNRVSGALRSSAAQGFDIWHYADQYDELPKLSGD